MDSTPPPPPNKGDRTYRSCWRSSLPLEQRRNRRRVTCTPARAPTARVNSAASRRRACGGVSRRGNEDSTERYEAGTLKSSTTQRRWTPLFKRNSGGVSAAGTKRSSGRAKTFDSMHRSSFESGHITPQFSRRALRCPARSKRIMQWRACCAHVSGYHGRLQLLVIRRCAVGQTCGHLFSEPLSKRPRQHLASRAQSRPPKHANQIGWERTSPPEIQAQIV